jgi:ATP-dependent Clp protease protease subunit
MCGEQKECGGSGIDSEIWVTNFDEEHASKFRIMMMNRYKKDPTAPIIIYIDSYGGCVDALAKMMDTMDELPNPKITVCMGKAMSCGAILLSYGDYRYCAKHSRIMIHEASSLAMGDVHDAYADTLESKRLNEYFMDVLAKRCSIKSGYEGLRAIIKARDGRDIYLNAKEAIKFGIVDKIGVPQPVSLVVHEIITVPEFTRSVVSPQTVEMLQQKEEKISKCLQEPEKIEPEKTIKKKQKAKNDSKSHK